MSVFLSKLTNFGDPPRDERMEKRWIRSPTHPRTKVDETRGRFRLPSESWPS
jgi:hypothetical protein